MVPRSASAITAIAFGCPSAVRRVPSRGSTATSTCGPWPLPTDSPLKSIGASSFSPSPITTTPSMETVSSISRIASTAAWSALSFSPRPIQRAAPIAAASVTRTISSARFRSGASATEFLEANRRAGCERHCESEPEPRAVAERTEGDGKKAAPVEMDQTAHPEHGNEASQQEAQQRGGSCPPDSCETDEFDEKQRDGSYATEGDELHVPARESDLTPALTRAPTKEQIDEVGDAGADQEQVREEKVPHLRDPTSARAPRPRRDRGSARSRAGWPGKDVGESLRYPSRPHGARGRSDGSRRRLGSRRSESRVGRAARPLLPRSR